MRGSSWLDQIGRLFLAIDYRVWGIIMLAALLLFCVWRRLRYKSWPAQSDCFHLLLGLVGCIGGVTIPIVFLVTKPPAIEMLSGPHLVLIGLAVPVVIFGTAIPRLNSLLFLSQAPSPPPTKDEAKVDLTLANDPRNPETSISPTTNKCSRVPLNTQNS